MNSNEQMSIFLYPFMRIYFMVTNIKLSVYNFSIFKSYDMGKKNTILLICSLKENMNLFPYFNMN